MMRNCFIIRKHPTEDRIMVQIDNEKIEMDRGDQERVYKFLKKRLEKKIPEVSTK